MLCSLTLKTSSVMYTWSNHGYVATHRRITGQTWTAGRMEASEEGSIRDNCGLDTHQAPKINSRIRPSSRTASGKNTWFLVICVKLSEDLPQPHCHYIVFSWLSPCRSSRPYFILCSVYVKFQCSIRNF